MRGGGATSTRRRSAFAVRVARSAVAVLGLLVFVLGWREGLIVALAVPISFALALFVNLIFGYTINRVTLFALILALGLLVDDPITDVENIARYLGMGRFKPREAVLKAVQEVQPALILSTLAIIASWSPASCAPLSGPTSSLPPDSSSPSPNGGGL